MSKLLAAWFGWKKKEKLQLSSYELQIYLPRAFFLSRRINSAAEVSVRGERKKEIDNCLANSLVYG